MADDRKSDIFEANLARILAAACESARDDFESHMACILRTEAARARKRRRTFRYVRRLCTAAGAAAVLAAAFLYLFHEGERPGEIAQVTNIYGLVTVDNGLPPRAVEGTAPIAAGDWLTTAWGSRSRIVLDDTTAFETAVRTRLKLDKDPSGPLVHLSEGAVTITAAKQPVGSAITIETPAGRVKVLGTVLDVIAGGKVQGARRTRVAVSSGLVEITGAGKTIELPAGTFGVIDEGRAPERFSQVPQVNAFMHLVEQTHAIAPEAGTRTAPPMIIEDIAGDGSATVWMMVEIANDKEAALRRYPLQTAGLLRNVQAYSTGGWPIPTRNLGHTVELDLSGAPIAPGESMEIILCVPRAGGIFEAREGGVLAFVGETERGAPFRIVEFHLPRGSTLRRVSPEPLAAYWAHDSRVVHLAGSVSYPKLFLDE